LVSYSLILVVLFRLVSKNICRFNPVRLTYKALLAAICMGVFTFLFRNVNLFVMIGLSAAVYLAFLVALGEIQRRDLDLLRQLFRGNLRRASKA